MIIYTLKMITLFILIIQKTLKDFMRIYIIIYFKEEKIKKILIIQNMYMNHYVKKKLKQKKEILEKRQRISK